MHHAIKFIKVFHFADDTNLLNVSNCPKKLQKQLNIDLKFLYKWLLANKISLNCSKTELIIFKKTEDKFEHKFNIKLNGQLIEPSDSIRYLGIYLDSSLSGKHHCDILSKKLNRANGMLMKIRHYVQKDDLKSIYYAIFSSHMIYGSQIWGQSINTHTEKIFKLQNRALRIIESADFKEDASPLYKNNNILKLENHIELQNCLFVHDFLNNNLPNCFKDYFIKINEIHSIRTTSSKLGCLYTPYLSTTRYGLNSITKKCIDIWNFFTKYFKQDLSTLNRNSFKHKIYKYYIDGY